MCFKNTEVYTLYIFLALSIQGKIRALIQLPNFTLIIFFPQKMLVLWNIKQKVSSFLLSNPPAKIYTADRADTNLIPFPRKCGDNKGKPWSADSCLFVCLIMINYDYNYNYDGCIKIVFFTVILLSLAFLSVHILALIILTLILHQ